MPASDAILTQILAQLDAMQVAQQTMQAKVNCLTSPLFGTLNTEKFLYSWMLFQRVVKLLHRWSRQL
jgi:hypothetical protein